MFIHFFVPHRIRSGGKSKTNQHCIYKAHLLYCISDLKKTMWIKLKLRLPITQACRHCYRGHNPTTGRVQKNSEFIIEEKCFTLWRLRWAIGRIGSGENSQIWTTTHLDGILVFLLLHPGVLNPTIFLVQHQHGGEDWSHHGHGDGKCSCQIGFRLRKWKPEGENGLGIK